jgi:hypothetical protein
MKIKLLFFLLLLFNFSFGQSETKNESNSNHKLMYFYYFSRNDSIFNSCIYYHKEDKIIIDSIHFRYVQLYKTNYSKKNNFIKKFRKRIPSKMFKMSVSTTNADFECKPYGKYKYYENGTLYIKYYIFNSIWTKVVTPDL